MVVSTMLINKNKFFGYYAAVGVFIIMLSHVGAAGTFGVFFAQICADTQLPVTKLLYMSTIGSIVGCLVSLFGGKIINKITPRYALVIGTFCCCGTMLISSISTTLSGFYLAGVINGLLIGFGMHGPCSMVIADWFIEKRKKILGIVFAATGFGGGLWILVAGQLIANFGWRQAYQIMAAIIFVVNILCEIFLIKSPKQLNQKPLGHGNQTNDQKTNSNDTLAQLEGISLKDSLKTPSFYLAFLGIIFTGMLIAGYKTYGPTMMQNYGVANATTSYYMSALTFISGITIILSGYLANKTKPTIYVSLLVCCFVISAISLVLWAHTGANNISLILVSLMFCALAYPLTQNVPSTIIGDVMGRRYYSEFASLMVCANFTGQAIIGPILNLVLSINGDIANLYYVLSVFGILGLVCIILATRFSKV